MIPRMTALQRAQFALWFCIQDLFEQAAYRVSWAVVCAVALSVAASTVALALPWVTAEIRLHRLAETPSARCIWVFVPAFDQKLTPARLQQTEHAVRAEIRARYPGTEPDVTVAAFHDVDLPFFPIGGDGSLPRRGRTVGPNDPLLPTLPRLLRHGPGFEGKDGPGVILAPTLLKKLGGTIDSLPTELRIRSPESDLPRSWAVVGVTSDPIPLGYDFLLTEAEDARIRAADKRPPQQQVRSGLLPKGWPPEWEFFPASVRNKAASLGLDVRIEEPVGGRVLVLRASDPRTIPVWRQHLGELHDLTIKASDLPPAPEFLQVDAGTPDTGPELVPQPRTTPPERAAVYVGDLKHLRPAADAARELDLIVNDTARALVDEIETTADRAKAVALGLVIWFSAAGFVALILALYLRGQQKAAQIGMLRAMGANGRVLWTIAIVESSLLWFLGAASGLTLAAILGAIARRQYEVTDAELEAAAKTGWWLVYVGGYLGLSLFGCVVGNLLATRRVRRRPPAESLGLTS